MTIVYLMLMRSCVLSCLLIYIERKRGERGKRGTLNTAWRVCVCESIWTWWYIVCWMDRMYVEQKSLCCPRRHPISYSKIVYVRECIYYRQICDRKWLNKSETEWQDGVRYGVVRCEDGGSHGTEARDGDDIKRMQKWKMTKWVFVWLFLRFSFTEIFSFIFFIVFCYLWW